MPRAFRHATLRRFGHNGAKNAEFVLDRSQVIFGDEPNVTYTLQSTRCRNWNAIFNKAAESNWTVVTTLTPGSVLVNNIPLRLNIPRSLENLDKIKFAANGRYSSYMYEFISEHENDEADDTNKPGPSWYDSLTGLL